MIGKICADSAVPVEVPMFHLLPSGLLLFSNKHSGIASTVFIRASTHYSACLATMESDRDFCSLSPVDDHFIPLNSEKQCPESAYGGEASER